MTLQNALKTPRRVAILQSNYIPWKGYFDIIHDVDLFIFYDDLQYTIRDWRHRNRIKTAQGVQWLSIPAGEDRNRLICDVTLKDASWQAKHWRTLQQTYGKCPALRALPSVLRAVLPRPDLAQPLRAQPVAHPPRRPRVPRHHAPTFADSRSYAATGQKLDRLVDLVVKSGATTYLSGPAARDYIEPARFEEIGVELLWKDYTGYPEYPQRFPPFEHAVTVLDLLFNVGPDAPAYIWGWRDAKPPAAHPAPSPLAQA